MKKEFGILCNVSSLLSEYGIGDFGKSAFEFVDFLAENKVNIWQVLPLTETNEYNCPYGSMSYFAFDTMYVSPDDLIKRGLIKEEDLRILKNIPKRDKVNYQFVKKEKRKLLEIAFNNIDEKHLMKLKKYFGLNENKCVCYAYYKVLLEVYKTADFRTIPKELWNVESVLGQEFLNKNITEVQKYVFWQMLLEEEWQSVLKYAKAKGIKILGDMPIYPNPNSFDVFFNPKCFLLDKESLTPLVYGGVPADDFCDNGQNWGGCVYDWKYLNATNYEFFIEKIGHLLRHYDVLRLDHYLGYVEHYEIDAKNQSRGKWVKGGGKDLFTALQKKISLTKIVVEDIGIYKEEAEIVKQKFNLKGMRILQFANCENSSCLPQNVDKNCIYYLGTHDNDTFIGFLSALNKEQRSAFLKLLDIDECENEEILIKCVQKMIKSKAKTIILQAQDILMQGSSSRMNIPGKADGCWEYCLPQDYKQKAKIFFEKVKF